MESALYPCAVACPILPPDLTLRFLLALVSGVLFAISFPDVAMGWLMFVALLPLFVALGRAGGPKEAVLLGWLSHMVAWLFMVPWVIRVMSHYGGLPLPVGIAIFVAMAIYLGVYGGIFGFIVWRIQPGSEFRRWLLVAVAWAAVEFFRSFALMGGFPWNLIATSLIDYAPLVQFDRVAGPYALGILVLLPSVTAAWWIVGKPKGIGRIIVTALVAIVMLVWWSTGLIAAKLLMRPNGAPMQHAALLQPNISQEMRWDESNLSTLFQKMMTMTDTAARSGASVVIWPESTVPLSYAVTDFFRDSVESISRTRGVDVILGSVAQDPQNRRRLWNAAFLVSGGKTIGHYDKIRLVPFGEYVPFREMLFFAGKLVHDVGDFQFGTNDFPLRGRFVYGPAICYEVVFPDIPRTQVIHGANVLVTITNDAWYDGTSAPRQHLNMARMRAVENDRYLLRAGTTGISALVDPTGQIVKQLPMGAEGIIDAPFQTRVTRTPYVRFGDWFGWLAIVASLLAVIRGRQRVRNAA